jgi:MFS family permease
MVAAERSLAAPGAQHPASPPAGPAKATPSAVPTAAFLVAAALGAAAFQWHGFVASAPLALRFAPASDLPWLLPAFWVGFNLALWPAGWLAGREGPWRAMALGALVAGGGNAAAAFATDLPLLLAAQGLAGAGWALLLCSAFSGALALGQGGRAGFFSGALNAVLAAAALARIAVVSQLAPPGPVVLNLAWLAAAGFALCALLSRWQARHNAPATNQG